MSIPNYENPQLTIAQNLDVTAGAPVVRLHALVVGPQYRLNRYGKDEVPDPVAFQAGVLDYLYLDKGTASPLPDGEVVDLDSIRVHGQGLEAELADFPEDGVSKFYVDALSTPSVIRLDGSSLAGGDLNAAFKGRSTQVGDQVRIDDGISGVRVRKVRALLGKALSSSYGANSDKNDSKAANSSYNPESHTPVDGDFQQVTAPTGMTVDVEDPANFNALARGSKLGNRYGEEFTLTVRTGGAPGTATFNISSASQLWSATNVASTDDDGVCVVTSAELAGLTVLIDPDGSEFEAGQAFTFRIYGAYARLGDAQLVVSDEGDGYTGDVDTTYIIQVVTGSSTFSGAELRISDTAGSDAIQTVTTAGAAFNVGTKGLKLHFDSTTPVAQAGLRAGDTYYIHAKAPAQSTTEFDRVLLDGPAIDPLLFVSAASPISVTFSLRYTGEIKATDSVSTAWEATTSGVELIAPSLYVADRNAQDRWVPFVTGQGTVAISFRALVPPRQGEGAIAINSVDDIATHLGKVDLDNDLGFAANECILGAQGRRIYALRVASDTVEAYAAALKKVESNRVMYALTAVSTNTSVFDTVVAHVEAMSQEDKKKFRRAYFGTDSPGEYPVIKQLKGSTLTATITPINGRNVLLTTTNPDAQFTVRDLDYGDQIRVIGSGETYLLDEVISDTELLLQSGPVSPVSPAAQIEIWKADTPESQASYIKNISRGLGSRRACNIWVENGTRYVDGEPVVIPNRYLAAHIAGLRTAVFPQQGLTRTEITTITSAPSMYLRYSQELLNEIAAEGTFIVTQEVEDGAVFIRHQLTTETGKGSLYYEDSIGVNMDDLSFQTEDVLEGFIGKRNVNNKTLAEIRRTMTDTLIAASTTDGDTTVGPQIAGYEGLVVEQHPQLLDQVRVRAQVFHLLPLNRIAETLQGSISVVQLQPTDA